MIYVKGRWDVRLSKGWRYEPIMINAPLVPTPALHPQPHSSVARGETLQHPFSVYIPCPCFKAPLFVPPRGYCPRLLLCPSSAAIATGGASAGGDGGEAVTFKPWLSNPSLSDGLGTLKQDRRKKRTTGREGADILDGKWPTWCLDS